MLIIFLNLYVILQIYLPITVFNIRWRQLNVSCNCKYKTSGIVIWKKPTYRECEKNTTFTAISDHTSQDDLPKQLIYEKWQDTQSHDQIECWVLRIETKNCNEINILRCIFEFCCTNFVFSLTLLNEYLIWTERAKRLVFIAKLIYYQWSRELITAKYLAKVYFVPLVVVKYIFARIK